MKTKKILTICIILQFIFCMIGENTFAGKFNLEDIAERVEKVNLTQDDTVWTFIELPVDDGDIGSLYFLDKDRGYAAGDDNHTGNAFLFYTEDGGESWDNRSPNIQGYISELYFPSSLTGYLAGFGPGTDFIYKTENGGNDWQSMPFDMENVTFRDIFFVDDSTGWIVGYKHQIRDSLFILFTSDGKTWQEQNTPQITGNLTSVFFTDKLNGWAVGSKQFANPVIIHTNDGGTTWIEQDAAFTGGSLTDVYFINETQGWACGSIANTAAILETIDGGATWVNSNLPLGTIATAVQFFDADEGYITINQNEEEAFLYDTEDGGANWTETLKSLTGHYIANLTVQIGSRVVLTDPSPTVAGGNGNKKPKLGKGVVKKNGNGSKEYTLTLTVKPPDAQKDGCQATGGGNYDPGEEADCKAIPKTEKGWNFLHWKGDVSGGAETKVTMDKDKKGDAWFVKPELFFSGDNPVNTICIYEAKTKDWVKAGDYSFRASKDDDWLVNKIMNSDSVFKYLKEAKFIFNGSEYKAEITHGEKISTIEFNFPGGIRIPKSSESQNIFVTGSLHYKFDKEKLKDLDELLTLEFKVEPTTVSATPVNNIHGKKTDSGISVVEVGSLENANTKIKYADFQKAVDEASEGDILLVWDCEHETNFDVTKKITIKSKRGKESTTLLPKSTTDHTIHVKNAEVTIENLTINGNSGEKKAGIFADASAIKATIKNCDFSSNYYGVVFKIAPESELTDCFFSENTTGIYLDQAEKSELKNNNIQKSKGNGMHIKEAKEYNITNNTASHSDSSGVLIEKVEFASTKSSLNGSIVFKVDVRQNKTNGLFLKNCKGVKVEDMIGISNNQHNGILAQNCENIVLTKNLIIKNNYKAGIEIDNCTGVEISENKTEDNTETGISIINCKNSTSGANKVFGNTISGNRVQNKQVVGIYISNSNDVIIGDAQKKNSIFSAKKFGIQIDKDSYGNKIAGNEIKWCDKSGIKLSKAGNTKIYGTNIVGPENENGIQIDSCENTEIKNALIENNLNNGIVVNGSKTTVIGDQSAKNTINKNNGFGIILDNCDASSSAQNQIVGNNISNNDSSGVSISKTLLTKIKENKIFENKKFGIIINNSSINDIEGNKVEKNQEDGIYIYSSSDHDIFENEIRNNNGNGISVVKGNFNVNSAIYVFGNTIMDNKIGVYLKNTSQTAIWEGPSYLPAKQNKIILNSECGIKLLECKPTSGNKKNYIRNAMIKNNSTGIWIENSSNLEIGSNSYKNAIESNSKYGIVLKRSNKILMQNNQVGPKNGSGIYADNCNCSSDDAIELYNSEIFENLGHGIFLNQSSGIKIGAMGQTSNKIYGNKNSGVHLKSCLSSGTGTPNIIENNIIGNKQSSNFTGVSFDDVEHCQINNNQIINNLLYGIHLESSNKNKINKNKPIGNNIAEGIFMKLSNENEISDNEITENIGNGIYMVSCRENYIPRKNSRFNKVLNNKKNGIWLEKCKSNYLSENHITENTLSGILLSNSTDNKMVGKNTVDRNKLHGFYFKNSNKNVLFGEGNVPTIVILKSSAMHNTGNGIQMENSHHNHITSYKIMQNSVGVNFQNCMGNIFKICLIRTNSTGIAGNEGKKNIFCKDCNISASEEQYTGIRLNNCSPEIVGCRIFGNTGHGFSFSGISNPVINKNNIYENEDMGVNNTSETLEINATNNWWGSSDGPGGVGTGSGDEVSEKVNFSDWRTDSVSTTIYAIPDTAYIGSGKSDSINCVFTGLENHVLDVLISDSLGWFNGTNSFEINLDENDEYYAPVSIPAGVSEGATEKIVISIKSRNDGLLTDIDSFYVTAYESVLEKISIFPDSVKINPNQSVAFFAQGLDLHNHLVPTKFTWETNGGIIDSTGVFISGENNGNFSVTVRDTSGTFSADAFIKVGYRLDQITVTPDSVELITGQSYSFTAIAFDILGNTTALEPTWITTGGTITNDGTYTAPDSSGVFYAVVSENGSTVAGSARIVVTYPVGAQSIEKQGKTVELDQNYPNPASRFTRIPFSMLEGGHVIIEIFDIFGRKVREIANRNFPDGSYEINVNTMNFKDGIYIYRLSINGHTDVKKMIIRK